MRMEIYKSGVKNVKSQIPPNDERLSVLVIS